MIVICLEGCHGCGKTELCRRFEETGFDVLDEAFLDMPEYMLHPQSLLMETTWVCAWFKRILQKANELKASGRNAVFIADRSPFSAVFYAANKTGSLLEPVIRAHMKEVREAAGIEVYTVYLEVERELLWSRIQQRLKREPGRVKYNEDKREWMEATLNFYDNFKWDLSAQNNHITLEELRDLLICKVAYRSPRFQRTLMDPSSMFSEVARAAASPVPLDHHTRNRSPTSPSSSPSPLAPSSTPSPSPSPSSTTTHTAVLRPDVFLPIAGAGGGAGAGVGSPDSAVSAATAASSLRSLPRTPGRCGGGGDGDRRCPGAIDAIMGGRAGAGGVKRKSHPSPCTPGTGAALTAAEARANFKAAAASVPSMASLGTSR